MYKKVSSEKSEVLMKIEINEKKKKDIGTSYNY